jgi:hypothetical protein
MNQSKLFILVLLLLLFIVSCSKMLLIPITLITAGFFVVKRQYNIALIVLSVLFFISFLFNNKVETFKNGDRKNEMFVESQNKPNVKNTLSEPEPVPEKVYSKDNDLQLQKKYHYINVKHYKKLHFVLKSLLNREYFDSNQTNINEVIDNYKINSVFDLSKTVLNREKNPIYNNFLEKITCINHDNSVDYIMCDNENYKKVYAFCELIYVYTLDLDKILELINVHKIMSVCELSAKRSILVSAPDSQTGYGFETLGLEYYLNERSFTRKYYDILELLELDTILNRDASEGGFTLEEKLYNYHNSNKEAVKDLNSIMVLFDYYKVFDSYILNMEDDDFNWNLGILKSVDLNMRCWDLIYFFTEYDVKERIIKTINKITSVDDEFLNRGSNPSNPFDKTKQNNFNLNLNTQNDENVYIEENDIFTDNLDIHRKRFKTIKDKNDSEDKRIRDMLDKKINLKFIRENFNQKMIDILNDLVILRSKRCDLDCYDSNNPTLSRVVFYLKEMLKILTKDERLLFVGILFISMSIIFYFLGASK